MDNKIEVFKNEQFGEIRTALIENEPWFAAVHPPPFYRGSTDTPPAERGAFLLNSMKDLWDSVLKRLSGFVAVKAEINGLDVRTVREKAEQGFFSHAAQ